MLFGQIHPVIEKRLKIFIYLSEKLGSAARKALNGILPPSALEELLARTLTRRLKSAMADFQSAAVDELSFRQLGATNAQFKRKIVKLFNAVMQGQFLAATEIDLGAFFNRAWAYGKHSAVKSLLKSDSDNVGENEAELPPLDFSFNDADKKAIDMLHQHASEFFQSYYKKWGEFGGGAGDAALSFQLPHAHRGLFRAGRSEPLWRIHGLQPDAGDSGERPRD